MSPCPDHFNDVSPKRQPKTKGDVMDMLIWAGALVSLIGVAGLIYCVFQATRARRDTTDDAALKARLQALVAMNMAALAISAIGLMMVVIGILLG